MKTLILAGGGGTRMGFLTKEVPKPMLALAGKPILERQVEFLRRYGLEEIVFLTGYKGAVIKDYFGRGEKWKASIEYRDDPKPMGTAGAVKALEGELTEDFLVLCGDLILDMDLNSLLTFHRQSVATATIVVHPNDHPHDSDIVHTNASGRITAIHSKPHPDGVFLHNLVNAGVYVLSPAVLDSIPSGVPSDFGRDVFPAMVAASEAVYGYLTSEYIKDVGTPERIREVEGDVLSGRIRRLNREIPQKAIFLDRDGVLNAEVNLVCRSEDLALLPGVGSALRRVNDSDYLSIVVTNQPAIAKGLITEEELDAIHAKLETLLAGNRAYLNRIYSCPHHPQAGFEGERPEFKIACECRKPGTGMILAASREFHIETRHSFMVGDSTVDILAGQRAGLLTILLRTGYAGEDGRFECEPDFVFSHLPEAVGFILDDYHRLKERAESIAARSCFSSGGNPVIVLGGLSRSGKSTFARMLSLAFQTRRLRAKLVNLDHWLIEAEARKEWMTVRDRYLYDAICRDFRKLLSHDEVHIQRYRPRTRNKEGSPTAFRLEKNEILIIEGTIALDIPFLRETADLRLFVEIPESLRHTRFCEFYRFKGMDEPSIGELYRRRQGDESPIVLKSRIHADVWLAGRGRDDCHSNAI